MRRIRIYICLAVAVMALMSSCNEDYLDRYPLDEIAPQTFWKTPNDLKLYANSFYGAFPVHSGWSGGIFWFDNNSDNMIPGTYNSRLAGNWTIPSSGGGWSWGSIRSVNYFLNNLSTVEGDQTLIDNYSGEGYFFRALHYFNMVQTFGDVPFYSKPLSTDSEELYMARTPRKAVVDSIIKDLDVAIAKLPAVDKAEAFRVNKDVALALKARICLFEGTWEKYHSGTDFGVTGSDGSEYLELAAQAAKQIIDEGHYALYNNGDVNDTYYSLFNQVDLSANSEVILWKKYDVDLGVTHNVHRYIPRIGGNTGLSKSLVDSYLATDGLPISQSDLYAGEGSLEDVAANRDPRLAQTLYLPGAAKEIKNGELTVSFEKPDLDLTGSARNTSGFQLRKGGSPDFEQQKAGGIGTTAAIIYRYAEILLIYAEAKAELGTITQADLDMTVNQLRDRVNMPHLQLSNIANDPNWQFPELSPIINEVRRERRVELACEGFRFDDLMRWRAHELFVGKRLKGFKFIGSDLENEYNIVIGETLLVDGDGYIDPYLKVIPSGYQFKPERDYLNPIPTNELTLNPALGQNPGWDK
ncbi:RagB/SusD family nutrient uptake outer membrane protein [Sunxiuqinia sp. sy24]|uniref:RagB/SusD family nutrient uptake outer membrane protein n=1 Tax=Sunxiuqinia sp. sy24 TaxID=3461495 RepID=UPI0040463D9C